jgi:hypothetical protein
MLETEAKTKVCCVHPIKTTNHGYPVENLCVGSDCMGWNWQFLDYLKMPHDPPYSTTHGDCARKNKNY